MGRPAPRTPFASTLAVAACMATLAVSARVGAQSAPSPPEAARSGSDLATAQALFDDAKRLMDAKRFAEACPKLVESQRLDPGGGTTLVLAICHEGEGKVATAWGDYNQALVEARRDKRADRERAAAAKVAELAARVPRIQITSTGNEPGLDVRRDGAPIARAQWATAVPIDPAEYVFEATAPGKLPWRGSARIAAEPKTFNIMIPVLPDATAAAQPTPASVPGTPPPAASSNNASPPPKAESSSDRWLVSGIVGGAGIVVLAVGGVVGVSARSSWNDVKRSCPGNRCPTAALVEDGKSAGGRADVATGLMVVGGATIATAVILNLAWPSPSANAASSASLRPTPYVSRDGAGFALGGTL